MLKSPVSIERGPNIDNTNLDSMQSSDDVLSMVPESQMRIIYETQSSTSPRSNSSSQSGQKKGDSNIHHPTSSLFISDTQTADSTHDEDSCSFQVGGSDKSDSLASKKKTKRSFEQLFVSTEAHDETQDDIEDGSLDDSDMLTGSSSDELDHLFDGSVRTVPLGKSKPLRVERALFEEGAKRKKMREAKAKRIQHKSKEHTLKKLNLSKHDLKISHLSQQKQKQKQKDRDKARIPDPVDVILLDDDDDDDGDDNENKKFENTQFGDIIDLDTLDDEDGDNVVQKGGQKSTVNGKEDPDLHEENKNKIIESGEKHLDNPSNEKVTLNNGHSAGVNDANGDVSDERDTVNGKGALNNAATVPKTNSMDEGNISGNKDVLEKNVSTDKNSPSDDNIPTKMSNSNSEADREVPKKKDGPTKNSFQEKQASKSSSAPDDEAESLESAQRNELEISDSEERALDKKSEPVDSKQDVGLKSDVKITSKCAEKLIDETSGERKKEKQLENDLLKKTAHISKYRNDHDKKNTNKAEKKKRRSTRQTSSRASSAEKSGSFLPPLSSRTRNATRKPIFIDLTSKEEVETLDSESNTTDSEQFDSDGPIVKNAEDVELDDKVKTILRKLNFSKKEPLDVHSFLAFKKTDEPEEPPVNRKQDVSDGVKSSGKPIPLKIKKATQRDGQSKSQNNIFASERRSSRKAHTYKERKKDLHRQKTKPNLAIKEKNVKQREANHKKKAVAETKKKIALEVDKSRTAGLTVKVPEKKKVTYSDIASLLRLHGLKKKKEIAKKDSAPKAVEKEQNNAPLPVYSTSCIHCLVRGRSRYCNRTYPCDFCEKDSLMCRYPRSSRVINQKEIDSYAKMLSLQDLGINVKDLDSSSSSNDSEVVTEKNENTTIEKTIRLRDEAEKGILKNKTKHRKKRSRATSKQVKPTKKAKRKPKRAKSKTTKQKKLMGEKKKKSPQSSEEEYFVDAANDFSDHGEDADEEYEEDYASVGKKKKSTGKKDKKRKSPAKSRAIRKNKRRKQTVAEAFGLDEEEENEEVMKEIAGSNKHALQMLHELNFGSRDLRELFERYGTRSKRQATRENYIDIPEGDESDLSEGEKAYKKAEDAAEPLILSEDETERRMLRGQLPPSFVESMRQEHSYNSEYLEDSDSDSI